MKTLTEAKKEERISLEQYKHLQHVARKINVKVCLHVIQGWPFICVQGHQVPTFRKAIQIYDEFVGAIAAPVEVRI